MVKIQQSGETFTITVPGEFVRQAELHKGDIMIWSFNERGNMELRKGKKKVEKVVKDAGSTLLQ